MHQKIYLLPKGRVTITGADGLGLGASVVVRPDAWEAVAVTGDQRLADAIDLGGAAYPAQTVVRTEYGITVKDSSGKTYQLSAFVMQVPKSGAVGHAGFGGLAWRGPKDGLPPANAALIVVDIQDAPSGAEAPFELPLCFAQGTLIATPDGDVAIEDLAVGDMLETAEHGAEPIRWIGRRTVPAQGHDAPIAFEAGAIGNTRRLRVALNARLLLTGWQAELFFGEDAVWVPAASFLDHPGAALDEGGTVTYYHLTLDGPRTLFAEDVEVESLHGDELSLCQPSVTDQAALRLLFTALETGTAQDMHGST